MDLPPNLRGLSEGELLKYIDATRQEICRLEQEIIADLYEEEQQQQQQDDDDEAMDPASESASATDQQMEDSSSAAATTNNKIDSEPKVSKTDEKASASQPSITPPAPAQSQSVEKITSGDTETESSKQVSAAATSESTAVATTGAQVATPASSSSPSATSAPAPAVGVKSNSADQPGSSEEPPKDATSTPQIEVWKPPPRCVPICADVRTFNFKKLAETQRRKTGKLFDVIMTDPPWQLATSNPTRGVAIGYKQLSDTFIERIPFPSLQENGFLFVWVINAKYKFALELMEKWGYTLVDEIAWVKQTVNRRLAKSHGFYLQHAKETCLVGKKGDADPPGTRRNIGSDVLYCERQGQSQKPVEIYEMIEELVPGGSYLEIFARRNNLRDDWVSIGNEL